jgi:methyl-accepting chemotaxis protein
VKITTILVYPLEFNKYKAEGLQSDLDFYNSKGMTEQAEETKRLLDKTNADINASLKILKANYKDTYADLLDQTDDYWKTYETKNSKEALAIGKLEAEIKENLLDTLDYSNLDLDFVGELNKAFDKVLDGIRSPEVEEAEKKYNTLFESFEEGKVTVEDLDKGFEEFSLVFAKATGLPPEFASALVKVAKEAKKASDKTDDLVKSTDELQEVFDRANGSIDEFQDIAGDLSSVMHDLEEGNQISSNTVLDLIQKYPHLADQLSKLNDLTVDRKTLVKQLFETEKGRILNIADMSRKELLLEKDHFVARIKMLMSYTDAQGKLVTKFDPTLLSKGDYQKIKDYTKSIADINATLNGLITNTKLIVPSTLDSYGNKTERTAEKDTAKEVEIYVSNLTDKYKELEFQVLKTSDAIEKLDKAYANGSDAEKLKIATELTEQYKLQQTNLANLNNARRADILKNIEQLKKYKNLKSYLIIFLFLNT